MTAVHAARLPARRPVAGRLTAIAVLAVAAGLGTAVGLEPRDTAVARTAVLAAIGVVLLATLLGGRGRQRRRSAAWLADVARAVATFFLRPRRAGLGPAIWVALILVFAAWDFFSFSEHRHDLPTLSRALGVVTAAGWGRGALAAAWVVLGACVALGRRR